MALGLSKLLSPLIKTSKGCTTAELLTSHGFVHQVGAGIYDILPLGLRSQHKIEAIIRKRLNEAGCTELALTSLVEPALWMTSGRLKTLDKTPDNQEIMFTDERKYVMAPTAEEQITTLVGKPSYRQLPLQLYQISRKYRNELRPRGGLLRTREFLMKDLYGFHETQEDAMASYARIRKAYNDIFTDIGVPFTVADADSGSIGGDLSHEYHYLSSAGEDHVVQCDSCGYTANMERAVSENSSDQLPRENAVIETIDDVTVIYPPGRTVNITKLGQFKDQAEIIDKRIVGGTTSIVEPVEGDECSNCRSPLTIRKGIEVGHTFYLGKRYSEPLKSVVTHKDGTTDPIEMCCYGIGVTRILAAAGETLRDTHGLRWPLSIAPFTCLVVSKNLDTASEIASELHLDHGIEAVYEDRTPQLGYAMRTARESGWPILVIAGNKYESEGLLEIQVRQTGESLLVSRENAASTIKEICAQQ